MGWTAGVRPRCSRFSTDFLHGFCEPVYLFLLTKLRQHSTTSAFVIRLLLGMPPAAYVDPCRGHFVHRQAAGCCPIQITTANRVVTNGVRPATTGSYIPLDICQAVDSRDLRFLNKEDHTHDNGFDVRGSALEDLMEAAQGGVVDGATAIAELSRRVPGTADANERGTIRDTITALKVMVDTGIVSKTTQMNNGNLLKLYGLSVKRAANIGGPILSAGELDLNDMEALTSDLSSSSKAILQIRRAKTEQLFDTSVYMWSALAHSLGVMSLEISSHFIFEVAFSTRVKYQESFWTAQEYLIDCFDLIDRGICKASEVANHDRNLLLDKARRLGSAFADAYAKKNPIDTNAAPMEGGGSKVWNGKCQPATSKANFCQAWNRNKAHDDPKHLTSDGTCRFRHLCNHWVDNKGPSGRCENPQHGWHNCTNPNRCAKALE